MRKYILILFSLFVNSQLYSQRIEDFKYFGKPYKDEFYLNMAVSRVMISNDAAPNPQNHQLKGTTLKLNARSTNFAAGGFNMYVDHKLLGDLAWWLGRFFKGDESIFETEESGLSSGLLGWYSFLVNLNKPNRVQFGLGLNAKDFFLTSAYPKDVRQPYANPSNRIILEPSGNYYAAGPSVGVRYNLLNAVLIEYKGDLSIPFAKLDPGDGFKKDPDFKNPYFINHVLELTSSKGFYLGFESTYFLERTKANNSTKRNEIYLGFRFKV